MRELGTLTDRTRWLALMVLCLGDLMIVLDTTIVNVALPSIRADLGFSQTSLAWVVNAYLLTFGGFLLLGGRLGDLFGRRRLFMLGVASFTLFSLLCGLAPSATVLIAFRAAQGASAAFMVPQALATIQAATVGHERARAIGLYGAMAGIAAVVGQVAGGLIVNADIAGFGWRPIFLVNVPIGLVGLALA